MVELSKVWIFSVTVRAKQGPFDGFHPISRQIQGRSNQTDVFPAIFRQNQGKSNQSDGFSVISRQKKGYRMLSDGLFALLRQIYLVQAGYYCYLAQSLKGSDTIMMNFTFSTRGYSSSSAAHGPVFHLYTSENYQIILTCEDDFKMAMNLFALCAALSPDIVILTFELMSNHIHVTIQGEEQAVLAFFALFKRSVQKWLTTAGRALDLSGFTCSLRKLNDACDVRNVISYNNRNGFLANQDETPYSYRWGAGRFFFNPDAKLRYSLESSRMTLTQRRLYLHSHAADKIESIQMLDGYACPMSFCDIEAAEKYYKNASSYFYEISRNLESQKDIANEIGEQIRYTDNELFRVASGICTNYYNAKSPFLLPQEAKIELAKRLHFEWGANKKQLCRLLKMDIRILDTLFPSPN